VREVPRGLLVPPHEAPAPVLPALAEPEAEPDYLPPELASHAAEAQSPASLDPLLDRSTKHKARLAPLAVFILVAFAVAIYFATTSSSRSLRSNEQPRAVAAARPA
jgi:hypothetical protein